MVLLTHPFRKSLGWKYVHNSEGISLTNSAKGSCVNSDHTGADAQERHPFADKWGERGTLACSLGSWSRKIQGSDTGLCEMITVSTWDPPQPWAGKHQSPFFTRPLSPEFSSFLFDITRESRGQSPGSRWPRRLTVPGHRGFSTSQPSHSLTTYLSQFL